MIDEKKLIEEMEKTFPDNFLHYKNWFCGKSSFMDLFKELIEKFVPKVGEWIPCSEGLPKTNGVYNVTRKISEGEYKFYISDSSYFDGQNTWHADNRVNHGREYLKDVIAWKELDEPYKEGLE